MADETSMKADDEMNGRARDGPQPEIPFDLYCQQCGYNLRMLTSNHCPECGSSLENVRSQVSRIPWVHRAKQGRFRAYWRTVWLVMFRQRRFCDEMARPVNFAHSQRFRWVTILHVYLPILALTIGLYVARGDAAFKEPMYEEAWDAIWPAALLQVGFVLFLAAATGVPSYFFQPRDIPVELQNRAIAMSYYACGPLAITALPVAACLISLAVGLDPAWPAGVLGQGLLLFALLCPMGQTVAWWLDLIHIARRIMPNQRMRALLVAVCVPPLWLMLAVLTIFAFPASIAYVLLVVSSLT